MHTQHANELLGPKLETNFKPIKVCVQGKPVFFISLNNSFEALLPEFTTPPPT